MGTFDLIADAAFPVALLSVMGGLLPTALVIKTFPSETNVCIPSKSFSPSCSFLIPRMGEKGAREE